MYSVFCRCRIYNKVYLVYFNNYFFLILGTVGGGVTWVCPESVHHSASTRKKNGGDHVIPLTKPEKSALYSAPDKCHLRNWRNFLVQPLVLGPTVDTYVESH